jgi:protein TIF31
MITSVPVFSGFPVVHKHKLACLRQELIDAFVESRYMMFIKYAAVQLQQLGLRKQMDIFNKEASSVVKEEVKVRARKILKYFAEIF